METTRLSEKGRIVIPKSIRADHSWEPGTEFSVQDLGGSIALKPIRSFRRTRLRNMLGCAQYKGPTKSLKEMDHAAAKSTFEIYLNSDYTISIVTTDLDPAVKAGTPAATSRKYAAATQQIINTNINPCDLR